MELDMPAHFAPALFGIVLSGMMSFVVSGIATVRNFGFADEVLSLWLSAWLLSWMIAFPVVLVVAPVARRLVGLLIKAPGARLG